MTPILTRILALMLVIACTTTMADAPQAWALLDRAESFLQQGQTRAAAIELKNAAKAAPNNADVRLRLGQVYMTLGDPRSAAKELQHAGKLGADHAEVVPALARALIASGEPLPAIDLIGKIKHPSPRLLALRGNAFLAIGDNAAAQADFDAALTTHPSLLPALLGQALAALRQGDPSAAMPWASRALAFAPDSVEVWTLLAQIETTNHHYPAALKSLEQALRVEPDSVTLHLAVATVLLLTERLDAVQRHLDAVAASAPDNPHLHTLTAMLALARGDATRARDELQQIVKRYPRHSPALLALGKAQLALGEYQQAVETLRQFRAINPDSSDGALALGLALAHAGSGEEAQRVLAPLAQRFPRERAIMEAQRIAALQLEDFAEAAAIESRITALTTARARLDDAIEQIAQGEDTNAVATLDQAIAQQPSLLQPQLLKFRQLLSQRDFAGAEASARKLLKQLPDSALPPLMLGVALAGQGDLDAARAEFEAAWKKAPGNPAIGRRLALLALDHGNPAGAESFYLEVIARHPGHSDTLKQLASLLIRQGELDRGLGYLEQDLRHHPGQLKPRLRLARALAAAGRVDEAIDQLLPFDRVFGETPDYLLTLTLLQLQIDPDAAAQTARRLVVVRPNDARYRLLLAEGLGRGLARGLAHDDETTRYPAFYQALHEALALNRGVGLGSDLKPRQLIQLAALGQPGVSARDTLERLGRELPDNGDISVALTALAIGQKRFDDALAQIRAMRRRHPGQSKWMERARGAGPDQRRADQGRADRDQQAAPTTPG